MHWGPATIGRKDPRGDVKTKHRFTGTQVWKTSKNDFSDGDCPNLKRGGRRKDSLQNCKNFCLETQSCNAINYNSGSKDCVVRRCTHPVVPPVKDRYPAYNAYWLADTGS